MSHWLYAAYRRNLSNSQAAASWESPSHVSDSSGKLHPSSSLPIFLWAPPQSPLPASGHCFSILARSPCESHDFLSFLSLGNISLSLESQEPLPYTRKAEYRGKLGLIENLTMLQWSESSGRAEVCLVQGGEGALGRRPASTETGGQESTWLSEGRAALAFTHPALALPLT